MSKKIFITETQFKAILNRMVSETTINEGTNLHSLYHFTYMDALKKILDSGCFELSSCQAEIRNHRNFMSLTRHKTALEGFARVGAIENVRIEVDPSRLAQLRGSNIYPFEFYSPGREGKNGDKHPFFPGNSAKGKYQKAKASDDFGYGEEEYFNQAEESFEWDKKFIEARKITKRIDIFVDNDITRNKLSELNPQSELYDMIYVYDTLKDYNLQTNKCQKLRDYLR